MSCQRLNIGFNPCSPDNNCKTDNYNNQFSRYMPNGKREQYYEIQKSKEFIQSEDNNNLMPKENYNLLMDLFGMDGIKKELFTNKNMNIGERVNSLLNHNNIDIERLKEKVIKNKDYLQLIVFILTIVLVITLFNLFKK
tara:strand:+ start:1980 stop:2396 length:417 start_codon:yes stop_codon:yes gene_type:complete